MKYYFSTQTRVALFLNRQYYTGIHWLYVAEEMWPAGNPDSSRPLSQFRAFYELSSSKILDTQDRGFKSYVTNLKIGVTTKHAQRVIDDIQRSEIMQRLKILTPQDLVPVILVISATHVKKRLKPSPAGATALEWILPDLRDSEIVVEVPFHSS